MNSLINPLAIFYILGIIAMIAFFLWLKNHEKH